MHTDSVMKSGGATAGERFSLARLGGEYLREASVLVAVFGFLDPLVPTAEAKGTVWDRIGTFPAVWGIAVVAVSLLLFFLGSLVEWLRLREVP